VSVTAVVVTWNRQELLRECLTALLAQTRAPDRVVVVDNASTDDTLAILAAEFPSVDVVALEENTGGAGGFAAGLAHALEGDADWLWMLDDDTIPEPTALAELLRGVERVEGLPAPSLLCSRVVWTDGAPHPMNEAWPRWTDEQTALDAIERGLLAIRAATYVSILVARDAVQRLGTPTPDYFIWGDDVEFTARILKDATGYYVPESLVVHKTKTNYRAALSDSPRYAMDVRNKLWMVRAPDVWQGYEKLWWLSLGAKGAGQYLRYNRFKPKAVATIARGVRDGLRTSPAAR
jgi:rhamnopyranosyl-N-acetylglucosaminyl-diphospho-decaprenol beta-1,3/1,4-galactofuranosyltransferase